MSVDAVFRDRLCWFVIHGASDGNGGGWGSGEAPSGLGRFVVAYRVVLVRALSADHAGLRLVCRY